MRTAPIPYAAELVYCRELVRRSGAAALLERGIRRHAQGLHRSVSAEGWLTLITCTLSVYGSSRPRDLHRVLNQLLGQDGCAWLGLLDRDGAPPSLERLRYMTRIVEERLGFDALRPSGGASVSAQERLHRERRVRDIVNALVVGWIPAGLPLGDLIVFDATAHETPARPLSGDLRRQLLAEESTDLLLRSEQSLPAEDRRRLQRQRSHRALGGRWGHATPTNAQPKETIGGLHLHTSVVGVTRPGADPPPSIIPALYVTAAAGYSAAQILTDMLARIERRFPGTYTVGADRDYSKSVDLFGRLRARGQPFVLDLRADQLEGRGAHRGGLLFQGNVLCPATPEHLRNPGPRPAAREQGQPNPAKAIWDGRVVEQSRYRAHIRSVRHDGVNVACPALSPSPTVQCPLRGPVNGRRKLPVVVDPPGAGRHAICTQKTIFVPDEVNPLRQSMPWGRADWDRSYGRARAAIEGVHGELKHADGRQLQRWVTSTTFVSVISIVIGLDVALLNLQHIRAWVETHRDTDPFARQLSGDILFAPPEQAHEWLQQQLAAPN
ncbi:hypothetical protein QOZ88_07020 [Blastococcus sp. BMG 814]|uniref:Transposase DDE domain-containing protein n=1 Tax=Blastococcus carthaginiensis TaxID=3050034 RepID=A0ABT9I9Y3_9ACTN|nr:hypothetical protein [Blastococcus carthaginiensis]MDP5182385.1 hypothetical protein [Blastococcus carthaginiensis]